MGSKKNAPALSHRTIDEQAWRRVVAHLVEASQGRGQDEPIRIWHAGCGDGRESCLLLLLLLARLGLETAERSVLLYATDVDPRLLEQARSGRYAAKQIADFPPELVEAYLLRQRTTFILPGELRRKIIYGQHDLASDPPISRLDLLACSVPLDEFAPVKRRRVLAGFHFALKPGGFLFLGVGQLLSEPEPFTAVVPEIGFYTPLGQDKHESLFLLARSGALGAGMRQLLVPLEALSDELSAHWTRPVDDAAVSAELVRGDEKLRVLLESLADEVWLCGVNGNLVLVNEQALKGVGVRSLNELLGEDGRAWQHLEVYTSDGQLRPPEEAPLLLALRGVTVNKREEIVRHLETGKLRYRQISAGPLRSPSGEITGAVAIVRDISDTKEAEKQLQEAQASLTAQLASEANRRRRVEADLEQRNRDLGLINEISAILNQYLDLEALMPVLRRQLAQRLAAPAGAILLCRDGTDTLRLYHGWGLPPILEAEYQSPAFIEEHLGPVVEGQVAHLWPDLRQANPFLLLGLDVSRPDWQSYACFPLSARGKAEGVVCLFSQAPRRFEGRFKAFFETLGRQIGVAIQNAALYHDVVAKGERLQQLSEQVVTVQEEERRRLSRELHDEMGQVMVALRLRVKLISDSLPTDLAEPRAALQEMSDLIATTMHSVRRLAHDLRPPALDVLGLDEMIQLLGDDFAARTSLEIAVRVEEVPPLTDSQTVSLYRIVQEALTNAAKHSGAGKVEVTLRGVGEEICLRVEDDGRGFEAPPVFQPENANGIGLLGIWERAQMLGGHMEITSQPGEGTRLQVKLPRGTNQ
jgi:PAS domain S-box-containing protein